VSSGIAVPIEAHLLVARWAMAAALATAAVPAFAHQTLHEVRRDRAIAVHVFESDGAPVASATWEAWSPGDQGRPWAQGRTDASGWLAFVPDRPGTWRVRVIEAAGHGIDVGVEVAAATASGAAPGPSSAASPPADRPASPGVSYLVRLVLGLAVLCAVFTALVLARRKRDARGP
jgi:nickel transport protein